MSKMGHYLWRKGDVDRAEGLFLECLELRKATFGDEHSETLSLMNSLAALYFNKKVYEKAEHLYLTCLELRKKVHGEAHSKTLASMNNLAVLYKNQVRYFWAQSSCGWWYCRYS